MKTKRLIELLQAEDPSGELECCIGNTDIHFVSAEPAYWDGTLQVLVRDEANDHYNIVGAKYVDSGTKVVIRSLSITDAICNDVDLPIDYSALGSNDRKVRYKEANDKTRDMMRKIEHDNELSLFLEWAKKKGPEISGDTETLEEFAKIFFEKNLSRNDAIPDDIAKSTTTDKQGNVWHDSYVNKRKKQWDREVAIAFDGMDWSFTRQSS